VSDKPRGHEWGSRTDKNPAIGTVTKSDIEKAKKILKSAATKGAASLKSIMKDASEYRGGGTGK
jgi:hypothetical protein